MDILAALNFGIIISLNIRALGVKKIRQIAKESMKAGVVAGILLGLVYIVTGYIGMHTSSIMSVSKMVQKFYLMQLIMHLVHGDNGL